MPDDPREGQIVKAILKDAAAVPCLVVRKRHGTVFGFAGEPDLYGCYEGRHFEIEVKRPGEAPTPLQRKRMSEWADAGALVTAVTAADEFFAVLGIERPTKEKSRCTTDMILQRPPRRSRRPLANRH